MKAGVVVARVPKTAYELVTASSVGIDPASDITVDFVIARRSNRPCGANLSEHRAEAIKQVPSPTVVSAPAHRSGAMQGVEAIRQLQG